jgi:hypothetical protein
MRTIRPAFNNESIYQRRDEKMLSWLWQAIVNGVNQQFGGGEYFTGEEWERIQVEPDILYVVQNDGLYWKNEYVCNDPEIVSAGAALLALRGRIDLIFHSQEEFQKAHANIRQTQDLGDLDDHPF